MCGFPSCQRIHRGQDSACSGQDLWLLRTRCASDEYFKKCSLKRYRAGKHSSSPWFMKWFLFCGNGILFKFKALSFMWASVLFRECGGCVNVPAEVCACLAAFEATRFYNVSESSPLARELCDGPTCNEVESSINQWTGESCMTHSTIQTAVVHLPYFKSMFSLLFMCSLQDLYRRTSATMCLVVWRSSSLSAALATGTAVMTGNQFVGQTGSSTRTCVRWRCLPVETGRASSRFRCPSVLRVRVPSLAQSESTQYCNRLRSTSWFMYWKSAH